MRTGHLLRPGSSMYRGRHNRNMVASIFSALMAMLILFTTIFSSLGGLDFQTAFADEPEEEQILSESAEEYGLEKGDEGFSDALDKSYEEHLAAKAKQDDYKHLNTFGEVIMRVFMAGYINEVPNAVSRTGEDSPPAAVCDIDHRASGTLAYHNCDVPNLITEFFQDMIRMESISGLTGAERKSATIDNRWFGLPSEIPGDTVPVDPADRSIEYTALELFGYSGLKYTNYHGEWDHIKTMSSARALANYGMMDKFKLGANVVADAVAGGMDGAVDGWQAGMQSGGVLGAIGGAYRGAIEGAASASIHTVLDTSDYNIIASDGWYRVGFGGTLYNARELTQQELAAEAQQQFLNMLSSNAPDEAEIPEDLQAVQNLPDPPQEAVASCEYTNSNGGTSTLRGDSSGPTEAACERAAERAAESASTDDKTVTPEYTWDPEGQQAEESLKDWKKKHSNYFDMADKYFMECDLNTNEDNRTGNWTNFTACWDASWQPAANEARKDQQLQLNDEWVTEQMEPEAFAEWMEDNPDANFNAPYNRFICVDKNGNDMLDDNGRYLRIYDQNGKLNEECTPTRQPIQNGLFGTGYSDAEVAENGVDTRHQGGFSAIINAILPFNFGQVASWIASLMLGVAVFVTRVSNTVINLAFSPILENLGLDEIVISFIESIRDGIFLPLVILVAAIAGVTILFKAGTQRNYSQQFGSVLLIIVTFIVGTFMLIRPDVTVKAVDRIPSLMEQAVLGAIFSAGTNPEDTLCTADSVVSDVNAPKNIDGTTATYHPNNGLRSLMCENWRAFAFTPWVYGQWGTGMNDLYGAESDAPEANRVNNHNTFRVGDPIVDFGGDSTMNNWSVYQLDQMTAGTSTTREYRPGHLAGSVDRNMYRVVDFQAGPNNAKGVDSRFFDHWSGSMIERLGVSIVSGSVSMLGAWVMTSYSILKVSISFVSVFLVLFLPFMLLFGLYPGVGMRKLKGYLGTLFALMLQRVMIATLMAITFTLIIATSNSDAGYMLVVTMSVVVLLFMLRIRKDVMKWITEQTAASTGGSFGDSMAADSNKAAATALKGSTPGFVQNSMQMANATVGGAVTGAVGGFLAGGRKGITSGAKDSVRSNLGRLHNVQRRKGFGLVQGSTAAIVAARQDAVQRSDRDKRLQEISKEVMQKTNTTKHDQEVNIAESELQDAQTTRGKDVDKKRTTEGTELRTANTGKTRRMLQDIKKMEERIHKIEKDFVQQQQAAATVRQAEAAEKLRSSRGIDDIADAQREHKDEAAGFEDYRGYEVTGKHGEEIQALRRKIESKKNQVVALEDKDYKLSSDEIKKQKEIQRLQQEAERERTGTTKEDLREQRATERHEKNLQVEQELVERAERKEAAEEAKQAERQQQKRKTASLEYHGQVQLVMSDLERLEASGTIEAGTSAAIQQDLAADTAEGDMAFLNKIVGMDRTPELDKLRDTVIKRLREREKLGE